MRSERNNGGLITSTAGLGLIRYCLIILSGLFLWESLSIIAGAQSKAQSPSAISVTQRANDIPILEPGQPIQRTLVGAERYSYHTSLGGGEFIHLIVQQQGVDLAVAVFGPSGKQVTEVDNATGPQGSEHVLFVTGVPGKYLLEIYPREKGARSGGYEVRIEEKRLATERDRNLLDAYQLMAEGRRLFSEAKESSLQIAIQKFSEALRFWRLIGDPRAEAVTLSQIAKSYDQLGEKLKALAFYNQAFPLLQQVDDEIGVATTLNNIGLIHDSLGEKQEALDYYNRAIPILQRTGDRRVEGYTINNIGLVYDSLGEKEKALEHYRRALQTLHDAGDQRAEAATLNNIAFLYNSLGEKDRALDYFGQALPLLRAVGDRHVEAITINNIGYVYESFGDRVKALTYFNQALPILRDVGDRRVEAITLNNIGLVHFSLNEKQTALDYFNRSLPMRRAVRDRQGEATTLSDIGQYYASSGERLKALDYYNQALSLSRAVQDRSLEASILERIARVERARGNLVQARTSIEAAIEIIESLRTKIVSQELRASYFASSQQYFETYIDLLMQLHIRYPREGYDGQALSISERARARSLLEMLTEARASIRKGVDPGLVQEERSLQQVLNAKAAMQSRLLQADSKEDQLAALRKEINSLLGQYHDLEAQIRISSPRYAALTQPSPISLKEIQEQLLDADTVLLEYALGPEKSHLWIVTSNSLESGELPPREVIETATRRVYELLTERNRRVKFETAAERQARVTAADAEYLSKASALTQMIVAPVAKHLGPKGKRRLLIVGDGALNYLPFAALPLPAHPEIEREAGVSGTFVPLVVDHEVVSLPSVSALAALRRESAGRKLADKTLAVLADPVFEQNDERLRGGRIVERPPIRSIDASEADIVSKHVQVTANTPTQSGGVENTSRIQRLPFTRREAEEILALVPAADRMRALDFDASRTTAVSPELGRYRFVHFGTHGLLDSAHPELSGIVLSMFDRKGHEQDGYLRVHEIFNLKLPVELVVLSGCRTGLGKEIKGEGLVGMTRGFMYAGAIRVVVTLWDVSDEASARLMVQFYKGMLGKGLSPASALREAQKALRKEERWNSPYYWAGFVLQGEYR